VETRVEIVVSAEYRKSRLEDLLLDHFPTLSKMYLRTAVRSELCEVNGQPENIGYRLREGDFVEISVDYSRGTSMRPEDFPLDVVYEDPQIIVVNKPAGMLMHPSNHEKGGTLLNALVFHLNRERKTAKIRPGLVHRLDKETSGLVVVAKNARAHRKLARDFMLKRVKKRYVAVVERVVEEDSGSIEAPIGRYSELKHWSIKSDGKHSETRFRVIDRYRGNTLLELEPVTGRTNQLRIHCEMIGHPITGDTRRGAPPFDRLCLHAQALAFPHPVSREPAAFTTAIPEEFAPDAFDQR
jgi:23S rRNA pseudouridine1911/1915/1917 synthase